MAMIESIVAFWVQYAPILAGVFAALWALSEALAQIPAVKANSVFQAIQNGIKFVLVTMFKKEV
jgi:hypothetical protein